MKIIKNLLSIKLLLSLSSLGMIENQASNSTEIIENQASNSIEIIDMNREIINFLEKYYTILGYETPIININSSLKDYSNILTNISSKNLLIEKKYYTIFEKLDDTLSILNTNSSSKDYDNILEKIHIFFHYYYSNQIKELNLHNNKQFKEDILKLPPCLRFVRKINEQKNNILSALPKFKELKDVCQELQNINKSEDGILENCKGDLEILVEKLLQIEKLDSELKKKLKDVCQKLQNINKSEDGVLKNFEGDLEILIEELLQIEKLDSEFKKNDCSNNNHEGYYSSYITRELNQKDILRSLPLNRNEITKITIEYVIGAIDDVDVKKKVILEKTINEIIDEKTKEIQNNENFFIKEFPQLKKIEIVINQRNESNEFINKSLFNMPFHEKNN